MRLSCLNGNENSNLSLNGLSKSKCILLTFDDGMLSVFNNALPILYKLKIPSIIFYPAGLLGQHPAWEIKDEQLDTSDRIMNEEELRVISENFNVEIASHTFSHVDLQKVTEENAVTELVSSKLILENIINKKVKYFSFPYGSYNDSLIKSALNCGYEIIFTTQPEMISIPNNKKIIGRVSVDPDDGFLEFILKINGAYSWLPAAIRFKRKVKNFLDIKKKISNLS